MTIQLEPKVMAKLDGEVAALEGEARTPPEGESEEIKKIWLDAYDSKSKKKEESFEPSKLV